MIEQHIKNHCQRVFHHPLLISFLLLILSLFFGYFYLTLPTETSVESFVVDNDPDLLFYEAFKKQFGDDDILVVGFSYKDVYQEKAIAYITEQTEKLEELKTVKEVVSLSNVDDFIGSDSDFILQPLLDSFDAENPQKLRKRAEQNSLVFNTLVNGDGTAALFLIRPATDPEDHNFGSAFLSEVEELFEKSPRPWSDFEYHIAGWGATDVNMSRYMTKDMLVFMPLIYTLLIVLVSLALRNLWPIVLSIINVSLCLVWTMAFLHLVGGAMSPLTSILPPLMMALAVSDSIHIFTEFLKEDRVHQSLPESMQATLKRLAVPCFLTSFTTAIGFASLAISDVEPIRHFGIAAALGMGAEYLLSMTIIPLGIFFLRNKTSLKKEYRQQKSLLNGPLVRFSNGFPSFRYLILLCSVFVFCLSIYSALNIKIETNILDYFRKNSPVSKASRFIDAQLGGVETLEISLKAEEQDQFLEPANLQLIEKIENYLQQQDIVTEVTSVADFFREMNKAFHNEEKAYLKLPETRAMAAQYLLLYDGNELDNLLDENRQWARISARITEHNSSIVKTHIDALNEFLRQQTAGTAVTARITGKTLIENKLIESIVNSQIQSLSLAFVLIFLVMFAIFRSFKLGCLSIVPNVLPILLNFGLMGLLNIPLNTSTAIIAAVAIGIAVDDTIHFICEYQRLIKAGASTQEAVQKTIVTKGQPIITTSLIMIGGFGTLLYASFVPSVQFGFLSALVMVFAVVGDLVVLPAMYLFFLGGSQKRVSG
jgi:hydrophobe/amphiphile efflux-3 (HAE3) family protein